MRVITVASSFLTLAVSARSLTTGEVGLVVVLVSIWCIITMFDLGVLGLFTVRVAASHGRDDNAAIQVHVRHALLMLMSIGVVIAAAGPVLAVVLPWDDWIGGGGVSSSSVTRCVAITFIAGGASLPAALGTTFLTGIQRFATGRLVEAVGAVTGLVATVAVAQILPTPEWFLIAAIGAPLVAPLALTARIAWVAMKTDRLGTGGEPSPWREMAIDSSYYWLYNLANTASSGTITLIVGATRGLTEAAIVGVVARLFSPVVTMIGQVGVQLVPSLTSAIAQGDVAWVRSRFRVGLVVITGASAAACAVLVVISPWLTRLWVGPALVPTVELCAWMAVFTTVLVIVAQVGTLVIATEGIRSAAVVAVSGALAGAPLSLLLAQRLGAHGAIIGATAVWLGILAPSQIVLARRALVRLGGPLGIAGP